MWYAEDKLQNALLSLKIRLILKIFLILCTRTIGLWIFALAPCGKITCIDRHEFIVPIDRKLSYTPVMQLKLLKFFYH